MASTKMTQIHTAQFDKMEMDLDLDLDLGLDLDLDRVGQGMSTTPCTWTRRSVGPLLFGSAVLLTLGNYFVCTWLRKNTKKNPVLETKKNPVYLLPGASRVVVCGDVQIEGHDVESDGPSTHENQRPVRILALDGGGLRGCLTVQVLKELLGDQQIGDLFDLVIGTSTGGLLAAGLCCGQQIDDCDDFYDEVAKSVFSHWANFMNWWTWLSVLCQWDDEPELFPSERLEEIIHKNIKVSSQKMCEAVSLDSRHPTPKCALVSLRTDVDVPQPYVLRSYELHGSNDTTHRPSLKLRTPLPGTSKCKWWEACRATSAAPMYFDAMTLANPDDPASGNITLRDGGLVANDPAIIGVMEAHNLYPNAPVVVVSLGTGALPPQKRTTTNSVAKLLMEIVGDEFGGKEALHHMILRNYLTEGENYFRFNTTLEHSEMSDTEYMQDWRDKGEDLAIENAELLDKIRSKLFEWGEEDLME